MYRGMAFEKSYQKNGFLRLLLKCADNSYYTGHTDNIEVRLAQHADQSYICYTSTRLPVYLVFLEECSTRDEAFVLERKIKNWSKKKKEALIEKNWEKPSILAKKNFKK
jgi:predicted GIY-YIG superfamily endonuclease